jgi:hypothetical protein
MNLSPKAFWEFVSEVRANHPWFSVALLWALPASFLWPFLIAYISDGFRISDHFYYLVYRNPHHRQEELGKVVTRMNKLINEQEYFSFDNQQQIVDAITYSYENSDKKSDKKNDIKECKELQNPSECYYIALRANSNVHEFIRSFLQVNDAYIRLLSSGNDDGSVHRFVEDFYNSSISLLKTQPQCKDVYPAYSTLRSLHNRIDIISSEVKDLLNLEVLRMLTFAAAFLETRCKNDVPHGPYLDAMDIYNKRATEIVSRSYKNPSNSVYLRKLFWLDFSKYIAEAKKGNAGDKKLQNEYYQRMQNKLPPEFLRSKVNQNINVTTTKSEIPEQAK